MDEFVFQKHLFEQIGQKCNAEPIKELLRKLKDENPTSDIVLGRNKEEAVQQLKTATVNGHCTIARVFNLLIAAEETGHQHILLLQSDSPSHLHCDRIAKELFEHDPSTVFPRFEYPSNGYAWADFRPNHTSGGWTAKAYGLETQKIPVGTPTTEELPDGRLIETREFDHRDIKTTLVARWRPEPNILELRIDVAGCVNTQTLPNRRNAFWKLFSPVFSPDEFVGLDVGNLLRSLVYNRHNDKNQNAYSISSIELTDPRSGQIRVLPFRNEDIDKDSGRKESLESMKNANFLPSSVRVNWLVDTTAMPGDTVPFVLEKTENGPELRILKKIPAEVHEYVFSQLQSRL